MLASNNDTPAPRSIVADMFEREDFVGLGEVYYGLYDHLLDHGHAVVSVVTAPAGPDGVNWAGELADPESDSRPADMDEVRRWCILASHIDGCDAETSVLLWLDPSTGEPMLAQVSGPEIDRDIAQRIIDRDIGAAPKERPPKVPTKLELSIAAFNEQMRAKAAPLPVPANDNQPQVKAEDALPEVMPSAWHDQEVPRREWYVPDLIPSRTVTLLSGDGGLGKSLAALQLAAAGALGGLPTMGLQPRPGRVMYVGAEDEAQEFHRRLASIVRHHDKTLADLSTDFLLVPLADRDATLMRFDARGAPMLTGLFGKLVKRIAEFQPALVVMDTSADLFGGDENKRSEARAFIAGLRRIATDVDCAVLLLSHPSVTGMQNGSGLSGSTAWNNSVRSRLYLTAPSGDGADPDARILSQKKSNYGSRDGEIRLRWQEGIFLLDDGKPGITSRLLDSNDERVFLEVLSTMNRTGQVVSPNPSATYAPTVMHRRADAKGLSKKRIEGAMNRLLSDGRVKVVQEGPPSKLRSRLWVTAEDFGA